jgi:hypothetical protein
MMGVTQGMLTVEFEIWFPVIMTEDPLEIMGTIITPQVSG